MNANGTYSGLELGAVNGVYNGVNSGVGNGAVGNEMNAKLLLLDRFPGATVAYSLRKLRTQYNGPAIRVRRSSDNTEQDIIFDGSGNLDEGQLLTFLGGSNGWVTVWYDQSGSGRNATQTVQANQPRIANLGVIDRQGIRPAIENFNNLFLEISSRPLTSATAVSFFGVANARTATDFEMLFAQSDGVDNANRFEIRRNGSNNRLQYLANTLNGQTPPVGTIVINNIHILNSFIAQSNKIDAYINNLLDVSNTNSTFSIGNYPCRIGWRNSNLYWDGNYQEIIVYTSDQSLKRTSIEKNINNYYKIY